MYQPQMSNLVLKSRPLVFGPNVEQAGFQQTEVHAGGELCVWQTALNGGTRIQACFVFFIEDMKQPSPAHGVTTRLANQSMLSC